MTPWFHHKERGIGVTPASPAGWAATGLFVAALIGGRLILDGTGREVHLNYVLTLLALVLAFGLLVWRTSGPRA